MNVFHGGRYECFDLPPVITDTDVTNIFVKGYSMSFTSYVWRMKFTAH